MIVETMARLQSIMEEARHFGGHMREQADHLWARMLHVRCAPPFDSAHYPHRANELESCSYRRLALPLKANAGSLGPRGRSAAVKQKPLAFFHETSSVGLPFRQQVFDASTVSTQVQRPAKFVRSSQEVYV